MTSHDMIPLFNVLGATPKGASWSSGPRLSRPPRVRSVGMWSLPLQGRDVGGPALQQHTDCKGGETLYLSTLPANGA